MSTGLKELPKFKLAIEHILRKAEGRRNLITYPSLIKKTGYITNLEDVLIISRDGGYLRLNANDLKCLMQELEWIYEDIERRRRD